VDELDADGEAACARREAITESRCERDAQRAQVLATKIEKMVCSLLDDARAFGKRRELGLELDEIRAHPATEVRQTLTQIGGAACATRGCEAIEDAWWGLGRELYCDRHGLLLRCFKTFQRFLKLAEEATGSGK
jgi:hypothetical protein